MPASCSCTCLCLFCSAEILLTCLASVSLYSRAACHLYEYFFVSYKSYLALILPTPTPLPIIECLCLIILHVCLLYDAFPHLVKLHPVFFCSFYSSIANNNQIPYIIRGWQLDSQVHQLR